MRLHRSDAIEVAEGWERKLAQSKPVSLAPGLASADQLSARCETSMSRCLALTPGLGEGSVWDVAAVEGPTCSTRLSCWGKEAQIPIASCG